jgi:cyclopropane-fatty-acyl-phospholipid synthase
MEAISQQSTADVGSKHTTAKQIPSPLGSLLQGVITIGRLVLIESDGTRWECGAASSEVSPVTVRIKDQRLYSRLVAQGSLALGESYADGWWEVEGERLQELFSLLFANNIDRFFNGGLLPRMLERVRSWRIGRNLLSAAREDIRVHYDLSNEFFERMLDDTMSYSCGYATSDGDSLEQMQWNKLKRIAAKLGLSRGGTLLDIGCGWGGLLTYVGEHFPGVEGVGITLSEEQYEFARRRLRERGLQNRMRVQLLDFRNLQDSYDFVVSVGMFEHVGLRSYADFFNVVRRSLKPTGTALLHTIGIEEDPARLQDPWIDRYIFPGSRLPRLEELVGGARKANLAVGHVENWRPHYARTLKYWRANFKAQWPAISKLSKAFDARFYRIWDFYLQVCEACFIDSTVELYQVMLSPRPRWNFPQCFDFS